MGGPTGTVTFVFTDIEGSTAHWERDPSAMGVAVQRHDEVVRRSMAAHGGVVFSTSGDGFAIAFDGAGDAVTAALATQTALSATEWPADLALRVRMGIHTGEVHERDGDYFGPAVNRAARVMSIAPAGDILVSATTASLLPAPERGRLTALGHHELRGVPEPVELFGVSGDGDGWSGRALGAPAPAHLHLPKPVTELVGRQAELGNLLDQLGRRRLLTLAGPGGVGKTRLAVELAWRSAERFRDGTWFVELAGVTDPDSVPAAVAAGVNARPQNGASFDDALLEHLATVTALVVIDNCEHLVDAVAAVVGRVLAACPGVSLVTTSREALGLEGEVVWPVPSLDPDLEGPELFRARMFEIDASTPRTATDDEQIVALCRRLDGIPLAIELAAGQTRVLSVSEVVARLDDRFTLLRGNSRGRMERHQTLRATVEWSYRLLESNEQLLFDRFSVFTGGAALDAATAVCGGEGLDTEDILDLLASLVGKSMMVADRSQPRTRFRALETLREFGRERLDERNETTDLRDRHLTYFTEWAARAEDAYNAPRDRFAVPDRREWDNLRAALGWAIARGDVDRAEAITYLTWGWANQWIRPEHLEWVEECIAFAATRGVESARLEGCRAGWLLFSGDLDGGLASARRAIALAPSPDDPSTRELWEHLGFGSYFKGDREGMREAATGAAGVLARISQPKDRAFLYFMLAVVDAVLDPRRAEADRRDLDGLAEQTDSPMIELLAVTARTLQTVMSNDPATTAARAGRALAMAEELQSLVFSDNIRGMVSVSLVGTDSAETTASFAEQLSMVYEQRDWAVTWWTLEALATHWTQLGDLESAAVLYGSLEAGERQSRAAFEERAPVLAAVRTHPDATALMARGAAMSRDEIVAYSLERLAATGTGGDDRS